MALCACLLNPGVLGCTPSEPPSPVVSPPDHAAARPEYSSRSPTEGSHVVILGSGTPVPDPRRHGPSLAIVVSRQAYIVDAGAGVVRRAAQASQQGIDALSPPRLERVFITHLHSDHTLGLADLMLSPAVVGRRAPLTLYGPAGLRDMVDHLRAAFRVDLQRRAAAEGATTGYRFDVHEIDAGPIFDDGLVQVRAIAVAHGHFTDALGYRFQTPDRVVVVSGDTTPSRAVANACSGCDVLVHEVYCEAGAAARPPAVRAYHRSHHTSAHGLSTLAAQARPKLLVLTHLLPFGCSEAELLQEVTDRYSGETVLGDDLGVY